MVHTLSNDHLSHNAGQRSGNKFAILYTSKTRGNLIKLGYDEWRARKNRTAVFGVSFKI